MPLHDQNDTDYPLNMRTTDSLIQEVKRSAALDLKPPIDLFLELDLRGVLVEDLDGDIVAHYPHH